MTRSSKKTTSLNNTKLIDNDDVDGFKDIGFI